MTARSDAALQVLEHPVLRGLPPSSTAAAMLRSMPWAKKAWSSWGEAPGQLLDPAMERGRTPRGPPPGRRDPSRRRSAWSWTRRSGGRRGGPCRQGRSPRDGSRTPWARRHVAPDGSLEGEPRPPEAAADDREEQVLLRAEQLEDVRLGHAGVPGDRIGRRAHEPACRELLRRGRDDHTASLVGRHPAGASVLGPPRRAGWSSAWLQLSEY